MKHLKIGMIGLDTSHAIAFSKLLNQENETHHVKGGEVAIAYPGGSPDLELSVSRVNKYTSKLQKDFNVKMTDRLERVAEESDAILLETVDGRVHLDQMRAIVSNKKPIFVDKPFCLSAADALEMTGLAEAYETPIMSSSALRFADNLQQALKTPDKGEIIGADCYGPMDFQEKMQGYFWYGIHAVEMLYAILGTGSDSVEVTANEHHDLLVGTWKDGRIGTVRGNRKGNNAFGAVIHFESGSVWVNASENTKPFYASLLDEVVGFFHDGISRVAVSETVEIIGFIEAANESRLTNCSVNLSRFTDSLKE